jgi:phage terminase large subunit-like protein
VKPEYLAAECRKAQRLPRLENDFKRYHLNLWVEQATRWLPMDAWRDCGQAVELRPELRAIADTIVDNEDAAPAALERRKAILVQDAKNNRWRNLPEAMRGRLCYVGVDLSSKTDLTAVLLIFPPAKEGELWTLVPFFYCPRATLKERIKVDKVPYDLWERLGALTVTDGNVIDYDYIKRDIFEAASLYRMSTIAIDQFLAAQIAIQLNAEGLNAVLVRQGFLSLSGPSKELEMLLLGRMLDHGGHPVLTWCARNVATERDAMENIKPSKKKSTERIDGIVAAVMGLGVAMQAEPEADLDGFISNPVIA